MVRSLLLMMALACAMAFVVPEVLVHTRTAQPPLSSHRFAGIFAEDPETLFAPRGKSLQLRCDTVAEAGLPVDVYRDVVLDRDWAVPRSQSGLLRLPPQSCASTRVVLDVAPPAILDLVRTRSEDELALQELIQEEATQQRLLLSPTTAIADALQLASQCALVGITLRSQSYNGLALAKKTKVVFDELGGISSNLILPQGTEGAVSVFVGRSEAKAPGWPDFLRNLDAVARSGGVEGIEMGPLLPFWMSTRQFETQFVLLAFLQSPLLIPGDPNQVSKELRHGVMSNPLLLDLWRGAGGTLPARRIWSGQEVQSVVTMSRWNARRNTRVFAELGPLPSPPGDSDPNLKNGAKFVRLAIEGVEDDDMMPVGTIEQGEYILQLDWDNDMCESFLAKEKDSSARTWPVVFFPWLSYGDRPLSSCERAMQTWIYDADRHTLVNRLLGSCLTRYNSVCRPGTATDDCMGGLASTRIVRNLFDLGSFKSNELFVSPCDYNPPTFFSQSSWSVNNASKLVTWSESTEQVYPKQDGFEVLKSISMARSVPWGDVEVWSTGVEMGAWPGEMAETLAVVNTVNKRIELSVDVRSLISLAVKTLFWNRNALRTPYAHTDETESRESALVRVSLEPFQCLVWRFATSQRMLKGSTTKEEKNEKDVPTTSKAEETKTKTKPESKQPGETNNTETLSVIGGHVLKVASYKEQEEKEQKEEKGEKAEKAENGNLANMVISGAVMIYVLWLIKELLRDGCRCCRCCERHLMEQEPSWRAQQVTEYDAARLYGALGSTTRTEKVQNVQSVATLTANNSGLQQEMTRTARVECDTRLVVASAPNAEVAQTKQGNGDYCVAVRS